MLVACAKSKGPVPAAAQDLYTSARFRKARAYAETLGGPWFILSAEHGLVAPHEWLAPYNRYLPDTPRHYRTAWGEWVVARLELLLGDLSRVRIEIHAGEAYVQPLLAPFERRGVVAERPLHGLTSGRWQGWYDAQNVEPNPEGARTGSLFEGDASIVVTVLSDVDRSYDAREIDALDRLHLDGPGLYSWYVDEAGAEALGRGLGHQVRPGLVYVGQTGATRWPSGAPSSSTLLKRVREQHLRGRRSGSTLRLTFGSILDVALARQVVREELSSWMSHHLRVVPLVVDDPDSLGDLERQVVQTLDPPLNLDHVPTTPLRANLTHLRARGKGAV